jgi:hypothetical protein
LFDGINLEAGLVGTAGVNIWLGVGTAGVNIWLGFVPGAEGTGGTVGYWVGGTGWWYVVGGPLGYGADGPDINDEFVGACLEQRYHFTTGITS